MQTELTREQKLYQVNEAFSHYIRGGTYKLAAIEWFKCVEDVTSSHVKYMLMKYCE